jgi:hypothetical protein
MCRKWRSSRNEFHGRSCAAIFEEEGTIATRQRSGKFKLRASGKTSDAVFKARDPNEQFRLKLQLSRRCFEFVVARIGKNDGQHSQYHFQPH